MILWNSNTKSLNTKDINDSKNGNGYLYFLIKNIDFVSTIKLNFKNNGGDDGIRTHAT